MGKVSAASLRDPRAQKRTSIFERLSGMWAGLLLQFHWNDNHSNLVCFLGESLFGYLMPHKRDAI